MSNSYFRVTGYLKINLKARLCQDYKIGKFRTLDNEKIYILMIYLENKIARLESRGISSPFLYLSWSWPIFSLPSANR